MQKKLAFLGTIYKRNCRLFQEHNTCVFLCVGNYNRGLKTVRNAIVHFAWYMCYKLPDIALITALFQGPA